MKKKHENIFSLSTYANLPSKIPLDGLPKASRTESIYFKIS